MQSFLFMLPKSSIVFPVLVRRYILSLPQADSGASNDNEGAKFPPPSSPPLCPSPNNGQSTVHSLDQGGKLMTRLHKKVTFYDGGMWGKGG